MADVSPGQFGQYQIYGYRDRLNNVTTTAFHIPTNTHAGSFTIDSDRVANQLRQETINNPETDSAHHTEFPDGGGQGRWTRGNMEPSIPKVAWAGLHREHRNPTVLSGLVGVATHLHGSMPHADSHLSEEGAALSRTAAAKWGMKAHPENPTMRPNWSPIGSRGSVRHESEIHEMTGEAYEDDYDEPEWDDEDSEYRRMTDTEWDKAMDVKTAEMNTKMGVGALNASASGWPGAYQPQHGDASVGQTVRALRTLRPSKQKPKAPPQTERLF